MLRSQLGRSALLALFVALALITSTGWAAPFAYVGGDEGVGDLAVLDLATQLSPSIVASGRLVALDARPGGTRLYGARTDAVVVVDVTNNSVVATFPGSGGNFNSVRLNPAGTRVYLPTSFGPFGQVAVFDASSGAALPAINTGGDPKDLVFHPNGGTAYASDANNSNVRVIDVVSGSVQSSAAVGGAPGVLAINPGGTRLYVALPDAIAVFATAGMNPAGTLTGLAPTDVESSLDGTQVYVVDQAFPDLQLKRFDADTLTPTGSVILGPMPGFGAPSSSVAFDPSGARSYVTDSANNKVWVVDNASFTVVGSYSLANGAGPIVVLSGPSPLLANPASGSTLSFPGFAVGGAPSSAFIEFQNPGAGARSLGCQPPSSSAFTLINSPLNVPAGGSTSLEIQFSSATAGSFSASLSCTAGSDSFSYTLSATAVGDLATNPASGSTIAFAAVQPGAGATRREIDFRNGSVNSISVACSAPSQTEFSIAPSTFTVPAFGNVRLRLQFASAAPGSYSDTLQCSLGTGGNNSFPLTGQALLPLTSAPAAGATVALRTVSRGAPSPTADIIFQNSGSLDNAISCSAPVAGFSLSTLPLTVPANGGSSLTVSMNTAVIGIHRDTVECADLTGQSYRLDLSGRVVQPIYAYAGGVGRVAIIDTLDESVVADVALGSSLNNPQIAVTADASKAYVVDGNDELFVLDSATRSIQARIFPGGGDIVSVNAAGTRVYVGSDLGNVVRVIDTNTNSVVATVPLGAVPRSLDVSPDGSRYYVAEGFGGPSITIFDAASNTQLIQAPSFSDYPEQLLVSPAGFPIILSTGDNGYIRAFDANGGILGDAGGTNVTKGIAWQADGSRFFAAQGTGLTAFDAQSLQAQQSADLQISPRGVSLHPSGRRAYVTGSGASSWLSVVDTTAMTLIRNIPLDFAPTAIGRFVNGPRLPITSLPASGAILQLPLRFASTPASMAAVSFQNPDPDPASVSCQPLSAPGFSGPTGTLNLAAADNIAATIQHTGNLSGTYTDTLSCVGSGGESFNLPLRATVVDPLGAAPASGISLLLPAASVGAPSPSVSIAYTNPNAIAQDVECSLSAGAPFSLSSGSLSVPANAGGSLTVSVSTSAAGSFEDTLSCTGPLGQRWEYPVRAVVNGQITASQASGSNIVLAASFVGSNPPTQSIRFANSNPDTATLSCTSTAPADFGVNPPTLNINALSEADLSIELSASVAGSYSATLNCTGSGGEQFSYALAARLYAAPIAYVTNSSGNSVSLIDTATEASIATVALPGAPFRIAVHPSGLRALATMAAANRVAVIDAPGVLRAVLDVGINPHGIAITPDGRRALVANFVSGSVSVIDLLSLTVSSTLPLAPGLESVVVSDDGASAFVSNINTDTVTRIDLASTSVAGSFATCDGPSELEFDPLRNRLYVPCTISSDVAVHDAQTQQLLATIPIGGDTARVRIHPSLPRAYVLNDAEGGSVRLIDLDTLVAGPAVTFPSSSPASLSLHPDGDKLYVPIIIGTQANRLSVRDARTLTELSVINTGSGPKDVALQPGLPNPVALSPTPGAGSLIVLPSRIIGSPATMAFIDFQNLSTSSASLQCAVQPAAEFSVLPSTLTVAAMQTAALAVSYSATTIGTTGGTLDCSAFDGQQFSFGLSGTTLADQMFGDGFE
jgi:YVTN family beta-propeller protein